ncbi:YjbE family putative metal transport protein [Paenibacillus sp. LMG 31459]|uniref:YjbE family putative metal transport protein n=1 Tax=Paenibacillus phytohabitans TaxID=2654978 RepID=A0ABX1YSW1_9BACL|nr:TerC family protein [Paenibacillus phytohabitans]NOU83996.1 YjbE family putative metal transport protein [Paenibacillus phytohabitans]
MNPSVTDFILSLLNIVFLDLILAGDNAIVIGLAARNLQGSSQKKAILLGTGGAVVLRIIATILVVWLLKVPWLLLFGGLLLIMIAYRLLTGGNTEDTDIQAGGTLWSAVRTIIVADAAMGLDNVIAIAGAAKHNITLVVLGLLISVPIVVWGSTLFIKLINRYSWIIYIGSAVLGFTAASMITSEKRVAPFFEQQPLLHYLFIALVIAGILAAGLWQRHRAQGRIPHSGNSTR